ncbi:MAG: molybdopterin dinucleotide binding domain-containing protein, partial [Burkholderiales bacterium]
GGNPYHHHQDLNRLRRAWAKPETIIVHEAAWNATARLADIVLPATTTLERNDIGASSRDSYIFAMQQAIAPVGSARNDFDIFHELAARGGHESAFTDGRDSQAWIRTIYDKLRGQASGHGLDFPGFEAFWEKGHLYVPPPAKPFVLFEDFRADPTKHALKTPSGKIELYSERIASFGYADMPPHPSWLPPVEWLGSAKADRHPLHLITIQPPDRLHSQLDHTPQVRHHKVAGREKLWMNAADAAKRVIANGDLVRVYNDRGSCLAGVEIDARVMPGVAVISTGAWYDGDSDGGIERHGNPNVLTIDMGTSTLSQAPAALSLLVEIARWTGAVPPLRIDTPPELVAAA